MRPVLVLVWAVLWAAPLVSDGVWVLKTGPDHVQSIPLDPAQPVDAWRGLYTDDTDRVWVYVTKAPSFFAPRIPEVRRLSGGPWTVSSFFPKDWKPAARTAWLDRWTAGFQVLATLPDPGAPILFPGVLK